MAKAALSPAPVSGEPREWREKVGRAIERAVQGRGWSLKEFAAKVERDERQIARWFSGDERPQFDVLFALPEFQQPLVVALASLAGGVEIETVVRVAIKGAA